MREHGKKYDMQFHHMMMVTRDMDKAMELWRDLLGFEVIFRFKSPSGMLSPEECDQMYGVKNYTGECALLTHPNGANIELQQPTNMRKLNTVDDLGYDATGIHELCLYVDDIDAWFEKVTAAGYKPTLPYVWGRKEGKGGTFLFLDQDGNRIQMWSNEHCWDGQ